MAARRALGPRPAAYDGAGYNRPGYEARYEPARYDAPGYENARYEQPEDVYATLTGRLRAKGCVVAVDTSGAPLRHAGQLLERAGGVIRQRLGLSRLTAVALHAAVGGPVWPAGT